MDNPNPIYYKDLITPDDSIKTLIEQLDVLIGKYKEAQETIKGSAADAAKSLGNLSGATDEQRQKITLLTAESDKLAAAYKRSNDAESEVYRRRQQVIQAVKEQQRVDKLLVELNNSKEGSYNRLSAQYRLNKIRLDEMSAAERNGTKEGRALESETRAIYEEMSRLQKATGKYTLEVGHYENALRGLPGPMGQVISRMGTMRQNISAIAQSSMPLASKSVQIFGAALTGTIGIFLTFTRALAGATKTMNDFEQANANLATILGTNRDGIKALTDNALMLGRTTAYTSSQVTQLQTELAKLGFQQSQIINMSKSVLQFATAVGANLGEAAEVAGATLRAFGLTSQDANDALATLAVATNNSALNFERIRTSIGTVFPVANAFGISLKDTTALLGALANAGFDASSAATATRNILLKLADSNGKLAVAMGGPARTFDEFIDGLIRLRDAGTDLNTALELTDRRSVAAFTAFLSGAESARELRQSLEEVSDELDRIESERMATMIGSIAKLKSAWEGLILAFSNSRGPIKNLVDSLTGLLNIMTDLLNPGQRVVQESSNVYTKQIEQMVAAGATPAQIEKAVSEASAELISAANARDFRPGAKKRKQQYEQALTGLRQAYSAYVDGIAEQEERRVKVIEDGQNEVDAITDKEAKKREAAAKKAAADAKKAEEQAKRQRLADKQAVVAAINDEISVAEKGTEKMLELRLDKVEAERQVELEKNRQAVESERRDEATINAKYDKQALEVRKNFNKEVSQLNVQRLQAEQQALQLQIAITEDGTDEMLNLRLANINKQRAIELEQNRQKDEAIRQQESAINAKYDKQVLKETADFHNKLAERDMKAARDLAQAEFELTDSNERQKTLFRLQQEKARLEAVLKLNETATKKMTDDEVKAIQTSIKAIEKESKKLGYDNLYELLGIGFDSDQQSALNTAISSIKDSIGSLVESWETAADAAVNAADKQVEAAQKALDAEIAAREAGYANDVATAQKELALAKNTQSQAIAEKKKAQKAQAAIDALTQSSSLVTASANIWSSLSGIPYVGPALAAAAVIAMWASFAVAKVRAAQVTKQEQYGEGTVELLQGGSHASGNDIDLGTKPDGTRRRAEGGEFFAVINKRNSRRFRNEIPAVINALNDGTFADKYQRANAGMSDYAINVGTDVGGIERDVAAIRRQGDEHHYFDGQGREIIVYKNLTRRIQR